MSHQPAALGHWTAPTLVLPGRNGTIAAISCTHAQHLTGELDMVSGSGISQNCKTTKKTTGFTPGTCCNRPYLDISWQAPMPLRFKFGVKEIWKSPQLGLKSSPGVHYQNPTIPREMCHLHSGKKRHSGVSKPRCSLCFLWTSVDFFSWRFPVSHMYGWFIGLFHGQSTNKNGSYPLVMSTYDLTIGPPPLWP